MNHDDTTGSRRKLRDRDRPVARCSRALVLVLLAALLAAGVGAARAAVDANVATHDQLRTIKGIGPAMADRIIQERRKGPFKDLAEFRARVKGVGDRRARTLAASGLRFGPSAGSPDPKAAASARPIPAAPNR
ncbi:MAG TPA: helix-hairpin-helix domain-containing protein [Burkholderiaceae bacterium]|nr:helix-hairpin-helix domain-containing protein [Burkholderiaceae bacterium]